MFSFISNFGLWLLKYFKALLNIEQVVTKKVKFVTIEYDEVGVAKLTFNRPKKKNAITEQMYNEIENALIMLSNDRSVKVCLLTGAGDFYCAGNDLSNFSKVMHPLAMAKRGREILETFVDSFIMFGKPLIVAVNGPAIGIAVTTLGLCDRVFASDIAYFKTPFAALGQAPEGCSSFTFPKIMGKKIANEVLWEGKVLDAKEALACGLVHSLHPQESVEAFAMAYCRELALLSPHEVGLSRSTLRKQPGMETRLREVNRAECEVLQKKWVSKECFAALIMFLDNRKLILAAGFLRYENQSHATSYFISTF
jgi:peroxisomal 3,2-trans-enoyl-CoA isomerase